MTVQHLQTPADAADRLSELAAQARSKISYGETTGPDLLDQLAHALRNGSSLAGVDLAVAYPAETLLPDRRNRRAERILGFVRAARDILLFLPVLYTWYELQSALSAYGKAAAVIIDKKTGKHADPGEFLAGWQLGTFGKDAHGNATSFKTLGATAGVVVTLLAVVVTLTLLLHCVEWYEEKTCSNADLRQRVAQVLATATFLAQADPHQVTSSVNEVARLLPQLEQSTLTMVRALDEVAREVKAAVEGGPGDRIAEAMEQWVTKAERLEDLLNQVKVPAETLAEFRRLHESIAADQRELRAELAGTVQAMHQATAEMADHAEAAWSLKEEVAQRFDDSVTDMTTRFDQTVTTLGAQFDTSAQRLAAILHQLQITADNVGSFTEEAEGFLLRLNGNGYSAGTP